MNTCKTTTEFIRPVNSSIKHMKQQNHKVIMQITRWLCL